MIQTIFSHPQIIGLILDIIGAFYIARSFVFKTWKDIAAESYGTNYPDHGYLGDMGGNLSVSLAKQACDIRTGFIILILGFLTQILGILYPSLQINPYYGFVVVGLAALAPILLLKLLCGSDRVDKKTLKADDELSKKYKQ